MFKRIFFSGLKAFAPIVVTIGIIVWAFSGLEHFFGYLVQQVLDPRYYFDGLGIILGVILTFVLGILVNTWLVGYFHRQWDQLLKRIPVVKSVYNMIQDVMDYLDPDKKQTGQAVVVIETPLGRVMGFVTCSDLDHMPDDFAREGDIAVYIPLSYQIGGLTMIVPRQAIKPIDISVEQAMRFVITAGMQQAK